MSPHPTYKSLHLMLSPFHPSVADAYLADLAWALGEVRGKSALKGAEVRYA